MGHPLQHGRDLHEHFSSSGDEVAVKIVIKVHASGSMSVEGPLDEREWMLAALENAKDAVRNHRRNAPIIVPAKDVTLA